MSRDAQGTKMQLPPELQGEMMPRWTRDPCPAGGKKQRQTVSNPGQADAD
jgi:hypothetical protein